eukprot:scaffold13733_cov63-Phaeocystis_antarctica.AAC.1
MLCYAMLCYAMLCYDTATVIREIVVLLQENRTSVSDVDTESDSVPSTAIEAAVAEAKTIKEDAAEHGKWPLHYAAEASASLE